MAASPLARVRRICLSFPDAHEVEAWGEPTFRVKNKLFAMYASAGTHHSPKQPSIWVKSTPVNQQFMVHDKPERYFVPPYVGTSGWVGVRFDAHVNWKELQEVLRDAYDLIAPKRAAGRAPRARARRA